MKRAAFACAAVLLAAAPAAKTHHASSAAATVGTWNVQADQMDANLATGQFSVPSPLTMTRSDGSTVTADRAVGNFKSKRIALYGHVNVHDTSGSFGLQSAQSAQNRGPATLTTDQLLVNDATRLYDARGNVHYVQGDTTADAQNAHLDDKTHELTLTGSVHVVQGDRFLNADRAVYNTLTGAGTATDNVHMEFPGIQPQIATPKPLKGPKIP